MTIQENDVMVEMPRYKCHKEVWALKIKDINRNPLNGLQYGVVIVPEEDGYAAFRVGEAYVEKHNPQVGGYYVVYKGGYASYSPADAFEDGYTRL